MKPLEGRYQTATQVKGLSSEIINVGRDHSVHLLEVSMTGSDMVSDRLPSRSLRPWYGIEGSVRELGRSRRLHEEARKTKNLSFMGVNTHSGARVVVGWNNRKGRKPEGGREVGSAHSRGVAVVMRGEGRTHSKGLTLVRKGPRRHRPHTEVDRLW